MKITLFIIVLLLSGCATSAKKDPQNTFWLGCMNALLHFKLNDNGAFTVRTRGVVPTSSEVRYADAWCNDAYDRVKDK